jgi:hypothetical protein
MLTQTGELHTGVARLLCRLIQRRQQQCSTVWRQVVVCSEKVAVLVCAQVVCSFGRICCKHFVMVGARGVSHRLVFATCRPYGWHGCIVVQWVLCTLVFPTLQGQVARHMYVPFSNGQVVAAFC